MAPDPETPPHGQDEPAGDIAGRLAALAHLFAVPVTDEALLREAGLQVGTIQEADLIEDELAAEHYRLLSHDLVPDAGVFLEEDGMLGGPLTRSLFERMASAGFTPDDATRSTGHIVNELGFLAHLLHSNRTSDAAAFWKEHASGWMPFVALHLRQSDSSWFEALASAFSSVLDELQQDLNQEIHMLGQTTTLPPELPPAGLDLDDSRAGLARIGSFLAVPAHSGLVLSRTTLSRIGRSFRLPTGFGSRSRVVEGLLRSAAHYDGWDAVCNALIAECDRADACWAPSGTASVWQQAWAARLVLTRSILNRLRDAEPETDGTQPSE